MVRTRLLTPKDIDEGLRDIVVVASEELNVDVVDALVIIPEGLDVEVLDRD